MSQRWQNTQIWQLVARETKKCHGRRWRREAEKLFGLERGALRAFIDREHDDADVEWIERQLADMHRRRIDYFAACVRDAERAAQTWREERVRRHSDRRTARFDAGQDEVEAMMLDHWNWMQNEREAA